MTILRNYRPLISVLFLLILLDSLLQEIRMSVKNGGGGEPGKKEEEEEEERMHFQRVNILYKHGPGFVDLRELVQSAT